MVRAAVIRQWTATLAGSLSMSMSGAMYVWMAPLMLRFIGPHSPIPMTTDDTSWLSSVMLVSCAFVTIPAGVLADRCGRKPALLITSPLTLSSWVIALFTRSIPALYIVRLIQGAAVIITTVVTPVYIAEIAEPKLRGQLSGYSLVFWYIGLLYAYTTGPYIDYNTHLYVSCIPALVFVLIYLCVPESPYYLLMVEEEGKAYRALKWLRGSDNIDQEFSEIKETVKTEMSNKGNWKDLVATKKDRKAFITVQIVIVIKFMTGLASIILYATETFSQSTQISLSSDEMTILLAVVLIVTSFVATFMADSIGRKPLLLVSTLGAGILHTIIAVFYYLEKKTNVDVSEYMWISYIAMLGFCVIASVGLGPLSSTIQAEYFPSHTRAVGGGVTGIVMSLVEFISIKIYQPVEDYFGLYMNYVIFAAISFIGTVVFSYIIEETAGKSLGEIQKTFDAKAKSTDNSETSC